MLYLHSHYAYFTCAIRVEWNNAAILSEIDHSHDRKIEKKLKFVSNSSFSKENHYAETANGLKYDILDANNSEQIKPFDAQVIGQWMELGYIWWISLASTLNSTKDLHDWHVRYRCRPLADYSIYYPFYLLH